MSGAWLPPDERHVELPREAYRALALRAGDVAYRTPTRRAAFGT